MIEMKDIKGKIDKLVDRLKNDDALKAQFKKDPIKAVESVLGVDLPDEAVKKIIAEAKTKLAGGKDEAGNAVEKAGAEEEAVTPGPDFGPAKRRKEGSS